MNHLTVVISDDRIRSVNPNICVAAHYQLQRISMLNKTITYQRRMIGFAIYHSISNFIWKANWTWPLHEALMYFARSDRWLYCRYSTPMFQIFLLMFCQIGILTRVQTCCSLSWGFPRSSDSSHQFLFPSPSKVIFPRHPNPPRCCHLVAAALTAPHWSSNASVMPPQIWRPKRSTWRC